MNTLEQVREAVADQARLQAAVAEADIVPLLMSLVQLTGRSSLLERARPHIKGAWNYMQDIPEALQSEIRAALVQALIEAAAAGRWGLPLRQIFISAARAWPASITLTA